MSKLIEQGAAAEKYSPEASLGVRALRRLQSGHFLPTIRSRNLTALMGNEWAAEQDSMSDAYLDKWVEGNQQHGIDPRRMRSTNQWVVQHAGLSEGIMKPVERGVKAGKWSTVPLSVESFRKGDERMLLAVARYLINTSSLVEMSDSDFLFPQVNDEGRVEMVPFSDWQYTLEVCQDPGLWNGLGGMRGDLTPDKWPGGGARYAGVYAKAGHSRQPSGEANDAYGKTPVDDEFMAEFSNPDGSPRQRKYLAQKLQAISSDLLNDIKKGGNSLVTHHREISEWAGKGRYGEGQSRLPARELARLYAGLSRSSAGRAQLHPLISSPAQLEAINDALESSGFSYFTDVLGNKCALNVANLLESGVVAERQIQAALTRGEPVPDPADLVLG